jgi:hypothetical protein
MEDNVYKAKGPIKYSGVQYKKDAIIRDLDEDSIKELLKLDAIEPVSATPEAPTDPNAPAPGQAGAVVGEPTGEGDPLPPTDPPAGYPAAGQAPAAPQPPVPGNSSAEQIANDPQLNQ